VLCRSVEARAQGITEGGSIAHHKEGVAMSTLPQDHAEAIALFRREIVGALTRRELDRGDLAQALTELRQQRFRPPPAKSTKTYLVATLER
jgi:hypothetical protein